MLRLSRLQEPEAVDAAEPVTNNGRRMPSPTMPGLPAGWLAVNGPVS